MSRLLNAAAKVALLIVLVQAVRGPMTRDDKRLLMIVAASLLIGAVILWWRYPAHADEMTPAQRACGVERVRFCLGAGDVWACLRAQPRSIMSRECRVVLGRPQ